VRPFTFGWPLAVKANRQLVGGSAEFNSTMMGLPNGVPLLITSCLLKIYLAQSENHMGQPKGVSPLVY